jgi:quercetin dioxygenase-like cupin family protein
MASGRNLVGSSSGILAHRRLPQTRIVQVGRNFGKTGNAMTEGSPRDGPRGPFRVMGVTQYCRIRGADTGGAYSVMEHVFPPGAGPAFLHAHPAQESIGIIEGSFEFYSKGPKGKVAKKGAPGDIHHVAPLGAHGLKNVGDGVGRAFVVFHPADVQERFFEEFSDLIARTSGAPDAAAQAALFARHGFVLIEPPSDR